jgi:hypothetical protein
MLLAMRRASSSVSTFAIRASSGFSREYTYASDCLLASRTFSPTGIFSTVHGGEERRSVIGVDHLLVRLDMEMEMVRKPEDADDDQIDRHDVVE